MKSNSFAVWGTVCSSDASRRLQVWEDAYVVCENGQCAGVFPQLPERYAALPVADHGGKLILPGMSDLHVHAPQYAFRGLGMDEELIEWLNHHTFPEEAKYSVLSYAQRAYSIFVEDLVKSPTTRACIFATIHTPATLVLMELLEQSGLCALVGKVNMDRNAPKYLLERSAEESIAQTRLWLEKSEKFEQIRPILTPRFVPSVSDALMEELGKLQREYNLPVQSHLSENLSEVEWVRELSPESAFYGEAYQRIGLFGGECPTVMAHCVYSSEAELERMAQRGVFVAHCPASNTNLSSGIAPVRRFLDAGVPVGLGSDIAGGHSLSLFRAVTDAVQCSKLLWRLADQSLPPLSMEEAFYLATRGGGAFFGKVGAFEEGYAFDALVVDDANERTTLRITPRQRLERALYLEKGVEIVSKYVEGRRLF